VTGDQTPWAPPAGGREGGGAAFSARAETAGGSRAAASTASSRADAPRAEASASEPGRTGSASYGERPREADTAQFGAEAPRGEAGSPPFGAEVPRGEAGGPQFGAEVPRGEAGGPPFRAEVPRGEAGGPQFGAEAPRGEAGSPPFRAEVPRGEAGGPPFRAEVPRGEAGGPQFRTEAPRGEASASERSFERSGEPRRARAGSAGPPGEPDDTAGGPEGGGPGGIGVHPPRKKWRAAFFVLAGVSIVGAVAFGLLGSRLLVVRAITVTGTHLVTPAQVIAAAGVPAGTPLIRVDPAQVALRVEAGIRQVETARVSKQWPDGLAITIRERVPVVAVRMAGGGYDLVDHDGVAVTWAKAKPARLPLLETTLPAGKLRGDQGVATVSAVLAGLPGWLSHQVKAVSAGAPGSGTGAVVRLYLSGGVTVVWGGPDRAAAKAQELDVLMRDTAQPGSTAQPRPVRYYDVSAPGTVVTK
jgi:cell division protein FtsQ